MKTLILALFLSAPFANAQSPANTPVIAGFSPQEIASGAVFFGLSVAICHNLHRVPGVTIRGRGMQMRVAAVACYGIVGSQFVAPTLGAFRLPEGLGFVCDSIIRMLGLAPNSLESQIIREDLLMGTPIAEIASRHGLRVEDHRNEAGEIELVVLFPRE